MNPSSMIEIYNGLTSSRMTMQKSFLLSCYNFLVRSASFNVPSLEFEEDSGSVRIVLKSPMNLILETEPDKKSVQYTINRIEIIDVKESSDSSKLILKAYNSGSFQFNLTIEFSEDMNGDQHWAIKKVALNRIIHYKIPETIKEFAHA